MAGRADIARENGKKGGRPKGSKSAKTLEKEQARELARQEITKHLRPLIEAQVAQALGLKYLVVRNKKTGQFVRVGKRGAESVKPDEEVIEVWEKDPSTSAFTDLMNRALDKPREHVEMEMKGDWEKQVARLTAARGRAAAYDDKEKG